MTQQPLMELAVNPSGDKWYVAADFVPLGAVVVSWAATAVEIPADRYTVQVGRNRHIDTDAVRYLNHSCVPSTFVDAVTGNVVALRPLSPGDPLTFFYPATEWEMTSPFDCWCGNDGCLTRVTGARILPADTLRRYALNDHIRDLLAERDGFPAFTAAAAPSLEV
ncbi:SET domain-containing protein-lysine N-methyltransferase [Pseudosporangium ferrugineum]|uniref:SET domain-containing protein n=1 Tax=Pseudosporangium ferrugineum TaxID=439699 RepID=A0A2T0R766_9ACTN|nr:SET domain-containing protein-lysine N-methyltransferase [Pseudosporangium ferrugineum]PRY16999.1 SET domain-containing protein [Pseudosporangium ferrugineum]